MLKKFFYQKYRKVICLFLVCIIFFSSINDVFAKMLTIDEVSSEFNKLGIGYSSSVDSVNKKLDIYLGSEKVMTFNYTDEYIEYIDRDTVLSKETAVNQFGIVFCLVGVVNSILNLSGYEDVGIAEDGEDSSKLTDFQYDTYGIEMETEHYEYGGTDDSGTWSMSGEYIRYFKMSFDTDKIDALVASGEFSKEEDKETFTDLIPTLEATNVTENSVTLYPSVSNASADSDFEVYCYIYRSTSETENYEKISDMAVNCVDGVGLVDDKLQSNTTYYYKAIVRDGDKYSDVVKVTTKGTSSDVNTSNNDNEDDIVNPQTGIFFPIMAIFVMVISVTFILLCVKKKDLFKNIS